MIKQEKIVYNQEEIHAALKEFHDLYRQRPIEDNEGGMKSPHLFNTWYALKMLKPKLVIESGVWKGLGTWAIERAVPEAKLISIELDYSHLQFKSDAVVYLNRDIRSYDWDDILNLSLIHI